jgi:hypothetical protein
LYSAVGTAPLCVHAPLVRLSRCMTYPIPQVLGLPLCVHADWSHALQSPQHSSELGSVHRLRRTNGACTHNGAVPTAEYNSAPCLDAQGNHLHPCTSSSQLTLNEKLGHAYAYNYQSSHMMMSHLNESLHHWHDVDPRAADSEYDWDTKYQTLKTPPQTQSYLNYRRASLNSWSLGYVWI